MRGKAIVWIVSAAMTVVAAGSLGLGIAAHPTRTRRAMVDGQIHEEERPRRRS